MTKPIADSVDRAEEQDDGHDDADDADRRVLLVQIGLGAFLDGGGDFLHARVAGRSGQNRFGRPNSVKQRQDAAHDDGPVVSHIHVEIIPV